MYSMVFADNAGRVMDYPDLRPVGDAGGVIVELGPHNTIPLPEGSTLMHLPGRTALGLDSRTGRISVPQMSGRRRAGRSEHRAVGALLPAGYTRTLYPAWTKSSRQSPPLPLFGYTAVAYGDGGFVAAAIQTDDGNKWNPLFYNRPDLNERIESLLDRFPGNTILKQLARCALEYGCFTAQNIFYRRWEGGIPVSSACNARCLGCISEQDQPGVEACHERISYTPTVEEICEVGVEHLENAPDAIISFGQGCEGEPLIRFRLIAESIRSIRARTQRGTININTNAGDSRAFKAVCEAGLDSARVSLFSARSELYNTYHRPKGYDLSDVEESLRIARDLGVYTSLNLLVFPGITDRPEEAEALLKFVERSGVKMVQLRNLNIDPDTIMDIAGKWDTGRSSPMGIERFVDLLRSQPGLAVGNYTHPR